ncbi:VOC family protein [Novosphingobium sp. ST904]|uniref:VOC family protein n=1 Tax=Novosphingobium sp. ST904 TaxID=1684385 RepID=UPI0006C85AF5|nr:VOC family protein [Novosphingobium sp. ST904]KPH59637.1 lactoylglutathione lyase [Novosphingobium sp. ST904]TCM38079.1 glyoxalase/bleomycin resistance protein/dioxygenase superfamily protein [Novosphingobium sp. ST904]
MTGRIAVSRIIHTIHATTDIYTCRLLYQDALGGLVFAENYFPAEDRDAVLLYVTDHMVEPMAPRNPEDLTKPYARQAARIGQAFHSFEIKVADGKAASTAFREAGCTVASDYGVFFFVRPESTGGVLLEVCELPMPNDPWDRGNWDPRVGAGHHCTVTGLDHIACVTRDMASALHFFTEIVDGEVLEDMRTAMPQPARRVLLRVGDTRVAFIAPDDTEAGPLGAFLAKEQNGIYALVWKIADEARARSHFSEKLKLRLTHSGCVSSGFAIDPDDFLGARHEFVS